MKAKAVDMYVKRFSPTCPIDISSIRRVLFCRRHCTRNGRRLYRPYPFRMNGGNAHERDKRNTITFDSLSGTFTKEITAHSVQTLGG